MIIAGTAKDLRAAVHAQSGSAQVATGTMYCVVQLESTDADDGKYWDTNAGGSWQASPVAWPTGTHTQAGVWSYELPAAATTGKADGTINYTFTDNLTEASATTVCGGGEHRINAENPLATTDIPAAGPSAADISTQVQSDLATELGYLDAAISSRAATADITAIQDGTETLQTIADAIAAVSPATGSEMVTLTVQTSGLVAVPDVSVGIYDSANTALISLHTTDSNGQVVTALNDGTYKVRLRKAGYTFTVPETLTVSGTTSDSFTATAWAPSAPSAVDLCVVFGTLVDAGGDPLTGAVIEARVAVPDAVGGYRLVNPKETATTDADGYFELELVRGAHVNLICTPAGIRGTFLVPASASQDFATWEAL
jgi:hypothetical protein